MMRGETLDGARKFFRAFKFGSKGWFTFAIAMLLLTDLTILLNIPFIRQIFGFLFLTILPGLLILQILKLNKIESTEKVVLSVGLSISFLMFFGLLLNNLSLSFGYKSPLSTVPLLICFNLAVIALIIVVYRMDKNVAFSLPNFNLSTSEKAFLIVPILFPALSIFGMYVMNTTDKNIMLMFLLFLIPIYIAFVCFFNHKFPQRIYPVVIFLISISLLLLLSLRSNHLIGRDAHLEYYFFQTTLSNLHWSVLGHSTFDACLSISLLPTIYQSLLDINREYIFKIVYALIYSVIPLGIYTLSKKYIEELYAFIATIFFMSQTRFIEITMNLRNYIAIFFFALAIIVFFNDKIDPVKKRILFIVFMASCIVSHYSTTYIFFFIVLGTFVGIEILSKKYSFKKVISLTIVLLFFALVFFWYSQVTETAFSAGVGFIESTLTNLHKFFILESRGHVEALLGVGIMQKGIPHKTEFIFTWITLAFIAIGVLTMIKKYKEMVTIPGVELNHSKPNFLKKKFEVEYLVMVLVCSALLVIMVALPFVAEGYGMQRLYPQVLVILSICFVIGGITISNLSLKRQTFKKKLTKNATWNPFRKKDGEKNASQVRACLIILLVLIPYFLCVTGVTYQMFGYSRKITLNSGGEQWMLYVYDQESYGAKWLGDYAAERKTIYADFYGERRLLSQGKITLSRINHRWLSNPVEIDGYIYLRRQNIVDGELIDYYNEIYNTIDYQDVFFEKNRIYDTGGSEIYY